MLRRIGMFDASSRTNSSRTAPAIGSTISEERMGKCIGMCILPPQVIPQYQDDTEEQRGRVRADRSRLQTPEGLASADDHLADAVHSAVDESHVNSLPDSVLGHDSNRPHDRGVVYLVDVILVRQDAVQSGESFGSKIGRPSVREKKERREGDAAE